MADELEPGSTESIVSRAANPFGFTLTREPLNDEDQKALWHALASSFAYLFSGNPNGFYVRKDDGGYEAVHREATWIDYMAHLCGMPIAGYSAYQLDQTARAFGLWVTWIAMRTKTSR
jgi:hypothetical protein